MVLKQWHKTNEMATINMKIGWECDSNEDIRKYNSGILTVTWPSPQNMKRGLEVQTMDIHTPS